MMNIKTFKAKNFLAVLFLVSSFTACKKYGVEVPDGYDDASGNKTDVTIDTNMQNIDRSAFAKARIFPGLVDIAEPRVQQKEFTLDLNFSNQTADNLRIQVAPEPQYSTGFYAAPGELIKIIVPAGVNGLNMQIGGHTDNLSGKSPLLRDPIIYNVKALYPGVNYMRNLYGGTIYIKARFAIQQPVKFVISGAVASPDFVLGTDNDADWIAKVKASKVPWLELRAKRVIFLVPTDRVVAKINAGELNSATALMTEWNKKFDLDYNAWMGLSDSAADDRDKSPQGPWRGVLDIQLTKGYGHSGFPFVGLNDEYWFNSFTSLTDLMNSKGMWGTYHEFGHNCQQPNVWSWSTLGETTNNLFNFKAANRMNANYSALHPSVTSGFPIAIAYASEVLDGKNFDGADVRIDDPFMRMTPFVQIFELYGYDAMTKLYKEARHAQRLSINDIDKHDFTYEKLSEYTGIDLSPFFYFWGINLSNLSKAKIAAKYPMLNKAIWTYNPLTKTGGTGAIKWPISITASSEEQSGEGAAPMGRAAALADGNINTYWHSKWSTGTGTGVFPYTLDIDIKAARSLKGLSFLGRQNSANQRIKNIQVFYSTDNQEFISIGSTVLPNQTGAYNYLFSVPVTARYFRVICKDNYAGSASAALAEIGVIE